jgi:dTDP-4-dehydrorhamnose reductase
MGKMRLFSIGFHSSALRILITGGTGLLGTNWAAAMRAQHEVVLGTHRRGAQLRGTRTLALAYDEPSTFAQALAALRPELIVNAAGLSSVDDCERAPQTAMAVNAVLAERVAAAAQRLGIAFAHISTDHVFSGEREMYAEGDRPAPVNAYARSKLEGERCVSAACPTALIVRSNFFGWGHAGRQSISDWILAALRARRPLTMFTDVFVTPILATRLAVAVHELLAAGAKGIVHVSGDERVSKHAFAVRLAAAFGLPADSIREGRFAEAGLAAPRPHDMSLSNQLARGILGRSLGSLDQQFAELREQERSGLSAELQSAIMA